MNVLGIVLVVVLAFAALSIWRMCILGARADEMTRNWLRELHRA